MSLLYIATFFQKKKELKLNLWQKQSMCSVHAGYTPSLKKGKRTLECSRALDIYHIKMTWWKRRTFIGHYAASALSGISDILSGIMRHKVEKTKSCPKITTMRTILNKRIRIKIRSILGSDIDYKRFAHVYYQSSSFPLYAPYLKKFKIFD